MLQTLHDKLKGVFAVLVLGAIGVVFVLWGVEVRVGSFTRAKGIEVNGQEIVVEDVRSAYQEQLTRLQVAFGTAGVPEEMKSQLRTRALENAVQAELIRQRTGKLRYATSDAEVLEAIRRIPAFQAGGEFSADAYHTALRSIGTSPARFEAEQREFAIARQLDRAVSASAFVLPSELTRRVALGREARELAWVVVPAADFARSLQPDEAAIEAYYQTHKDRYQTEESANVEYVEIRLDDQAAALTIDEPRLREYYESVKDRYVSGGRRHARHILIATGDDPAKSQAKAQSIYQRALKGEDFARLARDNSDDPGSAAAGGDLGFAARGDFVPAFADAVWSMSPGEIRGPIKTEFGWHIIRLEAVEAGTSKRFEDVRAELEQELRRNEVEKAFGERQEELDRLAFEANGDLATVAAQMKLPVQRVDGFTRAGGRVLGANPAVVEAVFAPDTLAGRELRTVELTPGHVIALRAAGHQPARDRPLTEVRSQVEAAVRQEQAARLAAARAEAVSAQLNEGADWQKATAAWQATSVETRQPRLLRRDDERLPGEIREAAFRTPRPAGRARFGMAALGNGDSAVWMLSAVRTGSLAGLEPGERDREMQDAREVATLLDGAAYVTSMRAAADVDVNPKIFE